MNLVHCVITYNRMEYLRKHLETWEETRDKSHDWTLLIADDGSDYDVLSFIRSFEFENVALKLFINKRRGVHYQVNQLLKVCSERDFDLGFMAEDDTYFLQSDWDNLYAGTVELSGYEFLCYFNMEWAASHGKNIHIRDKCIYNGEDNLQSEVSAYNSEGQFWTFTKRIIQEIGYFDTQNFGIWGSGHTDFALRCCRLAFNVNASLFDLLESEEYIAIQDEDYKQAFRRKQQKIAPGTIGVPNLSHKGLTLDKDDRGYIPYNESQFNMLGEEILK